MKATNALAVPAGPMPKFPNRQRGLNPVPTPNATYWGRGTLPELAPIRGRNGDRLSMCGGSRSTGLFDCVRLGILSETRGIESLVGKWSHLWIIAWRHTT